MCIQVYIIYELNEVFLFFIIEKRLFSRVYHTFSCVYHEKRKILVYIKFLFHIIQLVIDLPIIIIIVFIGQITNACDNVACKFDKSCIYKLMYISANRKGKLSSLSTLTLVQLWKKKKFRGFLFVSKL